MGASYSDPLVIIDDEGIRLRGYLIVGEKFVPWEQIERVRALLPTLWNGRWRLSGSGSLRTWFAADWDRPTRQTIFVLHRRGTWSRIGFTAHDAKRVKQILTERGVLVDEQGDALPRPLPRETRPWWRWGSSWTTVILMAALVVLVAYCYPKLPERVATHFNIRGDADGWGHKSLLATVMIVAGALVSGPFVLLGYAMARTKAAVVGRELLWVGAATVAFLLALAQLTMRANLSGTQSMGLTALWVAGAWLICVAAVIVRMMRRLA